MNEALRQSGRTTRMIEEAKREAAKGLDVYILANNTPHAEMLERLIGEEPNIIVMPLALAEFRDFDVRTFKFKFRKSKDHIILADHYALEVAYAAVFEMMHRFDCPTKEQNETT